MGAWTVIDILIPTYNRSGFLKKNILLLNNQIVQNNLIGRFKILVSDNCSDDDTWIVLNELKNKIDVDIQLYRQEINVGLEPNAIYLLGKSESDYVMYLGDDDYIPDGYLAFVVEVISTENAFCVIPGFSGLYPDGTIVRSRYAEFEVKKYNPGFETVCELSNFGHQLSGLVLRSESLYKEYLKNEKYRNIYPFIFFVTHCITTGVSFYAPKYQVLVSQGNSKDWNYDASGLLIDIFRNYKIAFPQDRDKKVRASLSFVKIQSWRLRIGKNPFNAFKAFIHLLASKEVDSRVKISLFWLYPSQYFALLKKFITRKCGFSN
ncbi:glycosyl transferase family 2 [Marinobacter sp. LV10R520-4]|uniref:glycosyltransferase family 2 protein n=1 Tax=Marinobacter sp. LV10R520-4 TaxID=1761796 RepID=UPI000BF35F07|nr:glycosyltransferase family 2 protein [Marinobacter sp. LV10R520-4]PFG51200.1 glycosyl transferase family 2 [Marinobacter sp. LV10R520-4]